MALFFPVKGSLFGLEGLRLQRFRPKERLRTRIASSPIVPTVIVSSRFSLVSFTSLFGTESPPACNDSPPACERMPFQRRRTGLRIALSLLRWVRNSLFRRLVCFFLLSIWVSLWVSTNWTIPIHRMACPATIPKKNRPPNWRTDKFPNPGC